MITSGRAQGGRAVGHITGTFSDRARGNMSERWLSYLQPFPLCVVSEIHAARGKPASDHRQPTRFARLHGIGRELTREGDGKAGGVVKLAGFDQRVQHGRHLIDQPTRLLRRGVDQSVIIP